MSLTIAGISAQIRCSNLCTEIIEYTSPDEIAVCNLASVALPMFVTKEKQFDHKRLYDVAYVMTKNLNRVIDINYYPVERQGQQLRRQQAVVWIRWMVR